MVGQALAHQAMVEAMVEQEIKLLLAADGQDVTATLARIGLPIGITAVALENLEGRSQDMRMLHGALRTIQSLCVDNAYKWDGIYTDSLINAVNIAKRRITEAMSSEYGRIAYEFGKGFALAIEERRVKPGMIKGAA